MSLSRTLRALPTLLRVGVAETVAYRAEFLVWILTTTLPLVMLGLWSSVAAEAPFRGYTSAGFTAYYLSTLIVRNLTGSWVAWQVSEEIRLGAMSMRLLRPLHPYVAFASSHVAAIPFRTVVALPIAVILLVSSGASALTTEPLQLAMIIPSLILAWVITFNVMFMLGAIGFFVTKTMALLNLYFGMFSLFSGYLLPIDLLPWVLRKAAEVMPFRFMLSSPVELMTIPLDAADVATILFGQLAWAIVTLLLALWVWNRGIKRFEAVGG
ncbi:MAG: transporter permease [Myxococcales bacterium]|nr:transporter permease [Myxococcales bacterium]